jgi:integration host factor subunit beta
LTQGPAASRTLRRSLRLSPDPAVKHLKEQRVNIGGGSMTKAELVEEVSRVSDLTKKHSETIVDTVFKSIIDALHRGEKIELRGFGSFRLRKREPRKGRNPKTGDKVDVPPKKVPYFKPGKELKELINREAEAAEASVAAAPTDAAGAAV